MTTATKAVKEVNYTAEMTATVKNMYAGGSTVEAIAATVGRNVRSVVAKLSRELGAGYKRKEYASKTGAAPVTKEKFVEQIANLLSVDAETLGGLEKANKTTLALIVKGLAG